ncbi:hypothetical protein PVK06_000254 [Gossypium arboreum]|uniref:Retrotransposon gag domain-containing protein n=1 Tax=Gossypium arboreum TaxID=29729 RepID=A0ABR0QXT2_GOSAR|nr:hypothetical protein PVK06_000254 [Gossypium arboreum]
MLQLIAWTAFIDALVKHFRSGDLKEPEKLLAKLQQVSTVSDYRSRFEAITNRTMYLPPQLHKQRITLEKGLVKPTCYHLDKFTLI